MSSASGSYVSIFLGLYLYFSVGSRQLSSTQGGSNEPDRYKNGARVWPDLPGQDKFSAHQYQAHWPRSGYSGLVSTPFC
jgi:hypothetical protein